MNLPPSTEVFDLTVDEDLSFACNFCDVEQVHKIAQLLLPALAAVCIDSTTGDPFHDPSSIAADVRKELEAHLAQKSETRVAELLENPDEGNFDDNDCSRMDPIEIVADLAEEFAVSKRNLLGKISGWLMSESREDKIDDFTQEMEENAFWLPDRRETLAVTLLRNLDAGDHFCCRMKFEESDKLNSHKRNCRFRPVRCSNNGCKSTFSSIRSENHDLICPFKIIECEQKCGMLICRREMDRHCITACSMKLVNCPFNQVGCAIEPFPKCQVEKHCSEFLHSHLLYLLKAIYKQESTVEELELKAQLLEKSQALNELPQPLDVRSLTSVIKQHDSRINGLHQTTLKRIA